MGELGIEERITLKWILKKWGVKLGTEQAVTRTFCEHK
jgi:hypothetical protein